MYGSLQIFFSVCVSNLFYDFFDGKFFNNIITHYTADGDIINIQCFIIPDLFSVGHETYGKYLQQSNTYIHYFLLYK